MQRTEWGSVLVRDFFAVAPMARVHPKETRSSGDSDAGGPAVHCPPTSSPASPDNSAPKVGDAESKESENFEHLREMKMCLPTASSTFIASMISSVLMFMGLIAFGLAEGPDLARPSWQTLICRFAGWIFLFVLPIMGLAGPSVRDFVLSGVAPEGWGCLTGHPAAWMQQILTFAVYAMLTFLPIREGQPLGFFLVFVFGNILSLPSGAVLVWLFGPSCICFRYARSVAPTCHMLPIVGFGILLSGYLVLRDAAGVWIGVLLPLLLTTYEYIGTQLAARNFTESFVTRPEVREQYPGTNQGIVISISTCTFHAMAEGARLTLLYIDHLQNKDSQPLLPIISSVTNVSLGTMFHRFTSRQKGAF